MIRRPGLIRIVRFQGQWLATSVRGPYVEAAAPTYERAGDKCRQRLEKYRKIMPRHMTGPETPNKIHEKFFLEQEFTQIMIRKTDLEDW